MDGEQRVEFGDIEPQTGYLQGGVIAPGLRLAARAVAQAAAQLPVIDLRAPKSVIGKNTRDAMQAGIVIGEVARIDGLIDAVWAELGYKTRVVATGDDAHAMAMRGDGIGKKYDTAQDRESAYEMLTARAETVQRDAPRKAPGRQRDGIVIKAVKAVISALSSAMAGVIADALFGAGRKKNVATRAAKSAVRNSASSIGRNVGQELLRGVLGSLKR